MNELIAYEVEPLQMFLIAYGSVGAIWMVGIIAYFSIQAAARGQGWGGSGVKRSRPFPRVRKWLRFVGASALLVTASLVLWPLLAALHIGDLIRRWVEKRNRPVGLVRAFKVERSHLREPLMVEEIELREMVSVPMGGVPWAPFGHLNSEWETFKRQLHQTDQIYSFTAHWEEDWGRTVLIEGYVIKRGIRLSPHFVVSKG